MAEFGCYTLEERRQHAKPACSLFVDANLHDYTIGVVKEEMEATSTNNSIAYCAVAKYARYDYTSIATPIYQ